MGIICERCGRDIDALGQDNMGVDEPLCEDCWNEQQGHAVAVLRRENRRLEHENEDMRAKLKQAGDYEFVTRAKLNDMARMLKRADAEKAEASADPCGKLRRRIESAYGVSRERALALTKLDECEMWLERCEPKEAAAPAAASAAQNAAMPCLKDSMVADFKFPEITATITAEEAAKSLRDAMRPALKMAVE